YDAGQQAPSGRQHGCRADAGAEKHNGHLEELFGTELDAGHPCFPGSPGGPHGRPDQDRQHQCFDPRTSRRTQLSGLHEVANPGNAAAQPQPWQASGHGSERLHAVTGGRGSFAKSCAPIRNTAAPAKLANGSHCMAPSRPMRSATQPVKIGPGARPKALLASVRTAKAVPCKTTGVSRATIAPAGPAEAAARNMPMPSRTSCSVPGGAMNAPATASAQPTQ